MSSSLDTHKRIQTSKMYSRDKPHREATCNKPAKNHKDMPSFSSTLLDEIYRSIDGSDGKAGDKFDFNQAKPVKKQGVGCSGIEDKEIADFRRACLVENWMRREENRKVRPPLLFPEMEIKSFQDNDLMFFSSTSSSSDSSGALSSSDTEFFGPTTTKTPKVSCFAARPKPIRTGKNNLKDGSFFDDYANNHQDSRLEDNLIKSKSRALKIYANLKKMKQPISPGGKLTAFINSLFTNANGKKPKNADSDKVFRDSKSSSKASSSSNCSSASSFSRSCLSKYSPKSREKMREGVPRTVRFHPVSVIVDEDSRPCGHKSIYDDGRPPLPPIALSKSDKNRKLEEASINALKSYYGKRCDDDLKNNLHEDDDYNIDDGASDASSDLFELDHLALFRDTRFCQELPVYETTHFGKNRSLIC